MSAPPSLLLINGNCYAGRKATPVLRSRSSRQLRGMGPMVALRFWTGPESRGDRARLIWAAVDKNGVAAGSPPMRSAIRLAIASEAVSVHINTLGRTQAEKLSTSGQRLRVKPANIQPLELLGDDQNTITALRQRRSRHYWEKTDTANELKKAAKYVYTSTITRKEQDYKSPNQTGAWGRKEISMRKRKCRLMQSARYAATKPLDGVRSRIAPMTIRRRY